MVNNHSPLTTIVVFNDNNNSRREKGEKIEEKYESMALFPPKQFPRTVSALNSRLKVILQTMGSLPQYHDR